MTKMGVRITKRFAPGSIACSCGQTWKKTISSRYLNMDPPKEEIYTRRRYKWLNYNKKYKSYCEKRMGGGNSKKLSLLFCAEIVCVRVAGARAFSFFFSALSGCGCAQNSGMMWPLCVHHIDDADSWLCSLNTSQVQSRRRSFISLFACILLSSMHNFGGGQNHSGGQSRGGGRSRGRGGGGGFRGRSSGGGGGGRGKPELLVVQLSPCRCI